MAKFKLLRKHFIGDSLVEEGTVVGEGTSWPGVKVGREMEGVDDEGKRLVAEHRSHTTNIDVVLKHDRVNKITPVDSSNEVAALKAMHEEAEKEKDARIEELTKKITELSKADEENSKESGHQTVLDLGETSSTKKPASKSTK